jgi:transposase-like protein
MKRRKWSSTEKLQIASGCLRFAPAVLEGLRAAVPMAELFTRHQISQSQYYQWRDRLLQNGSKVFEQGGPQAGEERLRRDNLRLKALIGELNVELKKTTGRGYDAHTPPLRLCRRA